jgi:hypothetical protein
MTVDAASGQQGVWPAHVARLDLDGRAKPPEKRKPNGAAAPARSEAVQQRVQQWERPKTPPTARRQPMTFPGDP